MTKYQMIKTLMDTEEYYGNCGHVGSNSYCRRKKEFEKMSKAELKEWLEYWSDGESVGFER